MNRVDFFKKSLDILKIRYVEYGQNGKSCNPVEIMSLDKLKILTERHVF